MDLMTSHRNYQWLRNLITGDKKWMLYINDTHRRQWLSPGQTDVATPKANLHPKKVMLSVWWDANGIIYWKILPNGCTITADELVHFRRRRNSPIPISPKTFFADDEVRRFQYRRMNLSPKPCLSQI